MKRIRKQLLSLLLALTLCGVLPLLTPGARAADISAASYEELKAAFSAAPANRSEYVIELTGSFDIPEAIGLSFRQNITLTGSGVTLTAAGEFTGASAFRNGHFILGMNTTLTLTDGITLTGARGAHSVRVDRGTFNMQGGEISGNTNLNIARGMGGGVYVLNGGTFNMSDGEITENDAVVSGLSASMLGGGVRVDRGTFNMSGGVISENNAKSGGGVYVDDGVFNMSGDAVISENTTGGGVYFGGTGDEKTFYMGGSARITGNNGWVGGGVSFLRPTTVKTNTFTMTDDAEISNNTATDAGGGIMFSGDELIISGNAKVSGNTANEGAGVRLYVAKEFNLSGSAEISGNTAGTHGGGIWAEKSAVNISGDAKIFKNSAVYYGGGIHNAGGGAVTVTSGEITGNTAKAGGGIYTVNYSELTVVEKAVFSGNSADALYRLKEGHEAYDTYKAQVKVPDYSWSDTSAQYGYNNYDINFTPPLYTVTYAPGAESGVTGLPDPLTEDYPADETVTAAAAPARTGYTFEGWLASGGLEGTVKAGSTFAMPAEDVTLTAQWKAVPPTPGLTPSPSPSPSESPKPSESPDISESPDPPESPEPTNDEEEDPPPPTITPLSPPPPPPPGSTLTPNDGGGFTEIGDDGTPRGEWTYDEDTGEWAFEEYPPTPVTDVPKTGDRGLSAWLILLLGTALAGAATLLGKKRRDARR